MCLNSLAFGDVVIRFVVLSPRNLKKSAIEPFSDIINLYIPVSAVFMAPAAAAREREVEFAKAANEWKKYFASVQ